MRRAAIRIWGRCAAWALIGVLLLQPLLTFLAAPRIVTDADGRFLVLCTLEGLKRVDTGAPGGAAGAAGEEESCPALKLLGLLASAALPAAPLAAHVAAGPAAPAPRRPERVPSTPDFDLLPIRAPPVC
jgi:hypothetical protein